jgi:hypothetical protein
MFELLSPQPANGARLGRGSYQKEIYRKEFQKEISKLRRTVNLYVHILCTNSYVEGLVRWWESFIEVSLKFHSRIKLHAMFPLQDQDQP